MFFQNKTIFSDDYKILSKLGAGAFGVVSKWINKRNNYIRAVKMVNKSKLSKESLIEIAKEIDIIRDLDHPNIVRIFEGYEDQKYLYIVTEFVTGGELLSELIRRKKFTEDDWAWVIKQVLEALNYLHLNNVAHKDLKPENYESLIFLIYNKYYA